MGKALNLEYTLKRKTRPKPQRYTSPNAKKKINLKVHAWGRLAECGSWEGLKRGGVDGQL